MLNGDLNFLLVELGLGGAVEKKKTIINNNSKNKKNDKLENSNFWTGWLCGKIESEEMSDFHSIYS